jgi:transcriptional regulator with XRE-family HTH domain
MSRNKPREHLITDFGTYMRSLRLEQEVTLKTLGKELKLSPQTISNMERNRGYLPNIPRVKLWLCILGCEHKFNEAITLLRRVRSRRTIDYVLKSDATEHLDRIIDAYEMGRLDDTDKQLMSMIAIREYHESSRKRKSTNTRKKTKQDKPADSIHPEHRTGNDDISFPESYDTAEGHSVPKHSGRVRGKNFQSRSEKSPAKLEQKGKKVVKRKRS